MSKATALTVLRDGFYFNIFFFLITFKIKEGRDRNHETENFTGQF